MYTTLASAGTVTRLAKKIKLKKSQYNGMALAERIEYQKEMENDILHPGEYCSPIVDGVDPSAFGLLHFTFCTKEKI